MKTVLFYSSVKTKKMFSIQSYYRNDILILKSLGYNVRLSNSFADFFCFWKYNVAFLYFYRYGLIPAIISKCFCKKVYFTGGIDYLDKTFATLKQRKIQGLFFQMCNLFSDTSILVSTTDKQNIESLYGGKLPSNCKISYHIVDFNRFIYTGAFREKKSQFCTIAWMVNQDNFFRKGIDRAVRVFSRLVQDYPDYKLYIAGSPGKGSEALVKLIKELDIEKSVIYLGTITEEEKISLLKESMFYFQLSTYEGFGIAALEALAAGCIVIHSGRGGLKDAIGGFGYQFDIENEDEIVMFLKEYCSKSSIENIYLKDAINYVKENFSFNQRYNSFKEIIGIS
jgi:glycosyltransferase involved in cell wall biosynthesis